MYPFSEPWCSLDGRINVGLFLLLFRRKTKLLIKPTVRLTYCPKVERNYEAETIIRIAAATASAAASYHQINNVRFYTLPIVCPKTRNGFWFRLSIVKVSS